MDEKKIDTLTKKVDGMAGDIRTNGIRLDKLENRIDRLELNHDARFDKLESLIRGVASDLPVLSAQFRDVGIMAISDNVKIAEIEKRVDALEERVH